MSSNNLPSASTVTDDLLLQIVRICNDQENQLPLSSDSSSTQKNSSSTASPSTSANQNTVEYLHTIVSLTRNTAPTASNTATLTSTSTTAARTNPPTMSIMPSQPTNTGCSCSNCGRKDRPSITGILFAYNDVEIYYSNSTFLVTRDVQVFSNHLRIDNPAEEFTVCSDNSITAMTFANGNRDWYHFLQKINCFHCNGEYFTDTISQILQAAEPLQQLNLCIALEHSTLYDPESTEQLTTARDCAATPSPTNTEQKYCQSVSKPLSKIVSILVEETTADIYYDDKSYKKITTVDELKIELFSHHPCTEFCINSNNAATAKYFLIIEEWKEFLNTATKIYIAGNYRRDTVLKLYQFASASETTTALTMKINFY